MKHKGTYKTEAHIVLQDNESAMKLEKNGHKSMGQRSRHIQIRYFFITDQVQKGNVQIEYCPTDEMEGDYMTKPVQGAKYSTHRGSIMNLPEPAESTTQAIKAGAKAKAKAKSSLKL